MNQKLIYLGCVQEMQLRETGRGKDREKERERVDLEFHGTRPRLSLAKAMSS